MPDEPTDKDVGEPRTIRGLLVGLATSRRVPGVHACSLERDGFELSVPLT